jgi:hypothetical protein
MTFELSHVIENKTGINVTPIIKLIFTQAQLRYRSHASHYILFVIVVIIVIVIIIITCIYFCNNN